MQAHVTQSGRPDQIPTALYMTLQGKRGALVWTALQWSSAAPCRRRTECACLGEEMCAFVSGWVAGGGLYSIGPVVHGTAGRRGPGERALCAGRPGRPALGVGVVEWRAPARALVSLQIQGEGFAWHCRAKFGSSETGLPMERTDFESPHTPSRHCPV